MAKQHATLEDLLNARDNDSIPRGDIVTLLHDAGFSTVGDKGNWRHPDSPQTIYLPAYDLIKGPSARKMGRAIQAVQQGNANPAEQVPEWVETILAEHPHLVAERNGTRLICSAQEYPEFRFEVSLEGNAAEQNLRTQLGVYDAADGAGSLNEYVQLITQAEALGFKQVRDGESGQLVPRVPGLQNIHLSGTPSQLAALLKEKAIGPAEDAILAQTETYDHLRDQGFSCDYSPAEGEVNHGVLTVTHDKSGRSTTIPAYGELGWIDHIGVKQLQAFAIGVDREARPHKTTSVTPSKVADIRPPTPKQSILVLDASTLAELCTTRHNSDADWTDLLKETLKLPNVGKIIIPDYIADFEMRGVARHYNQDGSYTESAPITTQKNPEKLENIRKRFSLFTRNAVRRHVDPNTGSEIYLTEQGMRPEEANSNIIIWETAQGREMAQDIYQLSKYGRVEEIKAKYWRDKSKEGHLDPDEPKPLDKGELTIEEFTDKEIKWHNPVFIISSDGHYVRNPNNARKTKAGQPKTHCTTRDYLAAELSEIDGKLTERANHIKNTLKLQVTDIEEIYSHIFDEIGVQHDTVRISYQRAGSAFDDDAEGIYALIANGSRELAKPKQNLIETVPPAKPLQAPAPITASAAIIAPSDTQTSRPHLIPPTPETLALGREMGTHLLEVGLGYDGLAKRISELTPHMPETSREDVRDMFSGKLKIDDDHIYALVTLLIDKNPKIKDKQAASRHMIDLYAATVIEHHKIAQHKPIKPDAYHGLGEYLQDRFGEIGMADHAQIAELVQQEVRGHLKPEERQVDAGTIKAIFEGKHVASAGLALAIRKVLSEVNPHFDETAAVRFDQNYFSIKRPKPPKVVQLDAQKEKVKAYFGDLALSDIAKIADAGEERVLVGQRKGIGTLLGKGGGTEFTRNDLNKIGEKWAAWIREQHDQPTTDRFKQDFRDLRDVILAAQENINRGF